MSKPSDNPVFIREAEPGDCDLLANIIRTSFKDVARRFSLTTENCPKHPSHCTKAWVEADMERGVRYFLLADGDQPIGCVGLECPTPDVCYLERLSVLPEMRGRRHGLRLVRHVLDEAASKGVGRISIGIIAAQTDLKRWYKNLGFAEVQTKRFVHLPFEVCMMKLEPMEDGRKSRTLSEWKDNG